MNWNIDIIVTVTEPKNKHSYYKAINVNDPNLPIEWKMFQNIFKEQSLTILVIWVMFEIQNNYAFIGCSNAYSKGWRVDKKLLDKWKYCVLIILDKIKLKTKLLT